MNLVGERWRVWDKFETSFIMMWVYMCVLSYYQWSLVCFYRISYDVLYIQVSWSHSCFFFVIGIVVFVLFVLLTEFIVKMVVVVDV
jgi:hypothetical protein